MVTERGAVTGVKERVRNVSPDQVRIKALEECPDFEKWRMVTEFDLDKWRLIVKKMFIEPIVINIIAEFGSAVGVRGAMISADGTTSVPYPTSVHTIERVNVPGLEDLLDLGTDRPRRPVVDVYPLDDERRIYDPALSGFCEIMLKFYKNAGAEYDYVRETLLPTICVYDLSLLTKKPGDKIYTLPREVDVRSRIIKAVYPFDVSCLLPKTLSQTDGDFSTLT